MKNGTRWLRNLALGSMALVVASAALAQTPAKKKFTELSYAHYKIYAQVYSSHENGAVTYIVTHNPDRRVVIAYGTFSEQARMAASKNLKRCMENPAMFA